MASNFAVTAAHCLTKPGLDHFVGAGSIHLLLGYQRGEFTRHIIPDLVLLPPGADPVGAAVRNADFAVLHFTPPAAETMPLERVPSPTGTAVLLAGFNQDRVERLEADRACRVVATGELVRHDCNGTRGTSGGPLLAVGADGRFRLVGIQVAGGEGAGGIAVPAATIARLLPPP